MGHQPELPPCGYCGRAVAFRYPAQGCVAVIHRCVDLGTFTFEGADAQIVAQRWTAFTGRSGTALLKGVWALPRSVSGNRCHFILDGAARCLCQRWARGDLRLTQGEARPPDTRADARDCVRRYQRHPDSL